VTVALFAAVTFLQPPWFRIAHTTERHAHKVRH
jgi:hypothetical protein